MRPGPESIRSLARMPIPSALVALSLAAAACSSNGGQAPESGQVAEPAVDAAPATTQLPETESSGTELSNTESSQTQGEVMPIHVEGHRGARGLRPESTLQAFETALDFGVTVLELDLHLLSDGEVVVWHDNNLGDDKCRYADDSDYPPGGPTVASLSTEDLPLYQCDLNPDPVRFSNQSNSPTVLAGGNYQPVTLAALFEFVEAYSSSTDKTEQQRAGAAAVHYNIETKREPHHPEGIGDGFDGVNPGDFELRTLSVIEGAGLTDRAVIQSFDHRSLWAIRSINQTIRLSALTSGTPDLAEYASRGATIWSPDYKTMSPELIIEAHSLGLLVIPWTVNDSADMGEVLDNGADGFITDRPDTAAELE